MTETKNEGKPNMRQFAATPATPKKKNLIAAEPGETKPGETEAGETEAADEIPTMKTTRNGRDTLAIGQYFKVVNKDYWQYYLKTSDDKSVNLQKSYKKTDKKERLEEAKKTTIVKPFQKDGDKDETLKKDTYFKVAKGNEFKYYQKISDKGTRPTTLAVINETLADMAKTLDDAKNTTEDYMEDNITANFVNEEIQMQDMVAVDKNAKFSVSQLLDTAQMFRSLRSYERVIGMATNIPDTNSAQMPYMPYMTNKNDNVNAIYYHHRATIGDFIRIFDDIKVIIDKTDGGLSTSPESHTITFKNQNRIEFGKSVIYINELKQNVYNFLMRKTRKNRDKKLEEKKKKREGLLLLVIACSIGLPTRKFTNAYGFFEIFAKKHTIVNDSNIIRTLLNLNGINVDEVKEYGNRALELWEIYKKEFPHFKSIDDDNNDTKTLYSYPTATELRYIVRRAKEVLENILYGVYRDKVVEVETQVVTVSASDTVKVETKDETEVGPNQLSSKKPLNFLMSI